MGVYLHSARATVAAGKGHLARVALLIFFLVVAASLKTRRHLEARLVRARAKVRGTRAPLSMDKQLIPDMKRYRVLKVKHESLERRALYELRQLEAFRLVRLEARTSSLFLDAFAKIFGQVIKE